MPPLPKSSSRSAGESSSFESVQKEWATGGNRPRGESRRSSSAASPKAPPRGRTTKVDVLQDKISLFYRMLGTAVKPFGRFVPALSGIGDNLREMSNDAAEAWIELGQQDKRVLDAWITITSASTWGNVIGIHLAIFASAIPGGEYFEALNEMPSTPNDMFATAKAMGLSDEEIAAAVKAAEQYMNQGGPGDTVRTGGPPEPPVEDNAYTKSGIVSPEELGATQAGPDGTFPADHAPPNGR